MSALPYDLTLRLTNDIIGLEHASCSAGIYIVDLQKAMTEAEEILGDPLLRNELRKIRQTSDRLSEEAEDLHVQMAALAEQYGVDLIPDDDPDKGNSGGGGK